MLFLADGPARAVVTSSMTPHAPREVSTFELESPTANLDRALRGRFYSRPSEQSHSQLRQLDAFSQRIHVETEQQASSAGASAPAAWLHGVPQPGVTPASPCWTQPGTLMLERLEHGSAGQ